MTSVPASKHSDKTSPQSRGGAAAAERRFVHSHQGTLVGTWHRAEKGLQIHACLARTWL